MSFERLKLVLFVGYPDFFNSRFNIARELDVVGLLSISTAE